LIPKIIHTFAKSLTHSALLSHFAWLSLNSSTEVDWRFLAIFSHLQMTLAMRREFQFSADKRFRVKLTPMASRPPHRLGGQDAHPTILDNLFLGVP
ncbi:hypothetical protein, partial [Nostoc sp.]|uniref:hypothetical protein n=1 Tax=Nostoc sp. TaxID=1180 RepID=UPI002FFB9573